MSILFEAVYRHECRSTHQKLAMDGLRFLQNPQAEAWRRLFARHFESYLDGAIAPDAKLKDYKNHVLFPGHSDWGGAGQAATTWYEKTVESLGKQTWREAVYHAGLLSHYCLDVVQPFHTGYSETACRMHRIFEWTVQRNYVRIRKGLDQQSEPPRLSIPTGADWVARIIGEGAQRAHQHLETLVAEFDLEAAIRRPREGLTDEVLKRLVDVIGYGLVIYATLLDRAISEAGKEPARVHIGIMGVLARVTSPFTWGPCLWKRRSDRAEVGKIYREYRQTGCVIHHLPADEKEVRRLFAKEVEGISLKALNQRTLDQAVVPEPKLRKPKAAGNQRKSERTSRDKPGDKQADKPAETSPHQAGEPASIPRRREAAGRSGSSRDSKPSMSFQLDLEHAVVDAPSIGPKNARRLARIGVNTIHDLLAANPDAIAAQLNVQYVTPELVEQWQAQSRLMCRVPNLGCREAEILVGTGLDTPEAISTLQGPELLERVESFLITDQGERILRGGQEPDANEVQHWIDWASQSRSIAA